MTRTVIEVKQLSYTYDTGVTAVKDVSFSVGAGEVVVLLGPNGAGKTTLLKCVLGLLKPSSGDVLVYGRSIRELSRRTLARLMGYVPQSHASMFSYRVLDFVMMGRAPHHGMLTVPSSREREKALEALRFLGIQELANRTISEVSGGQMQLVLIARALVQEAKILVLDEPIAHLDVSNQVRVLCIIRELVRKGLVDAVLTSMHNPTLASMFGDKIVVLNNGKLVAWGPPKNVLSREVLESVYGIVFEVFEREGKLIVLPVVNEDSDKKLPSGN